MNYAYFPGCSLESTAREYDVSAKAVMRALDSTLSELPDWNCCGATGADVVSHLLSVALPARNLALAQSLGDQLVATCSSCYLNLYRANKHLEADPELKEQVDAVLAEIGLHYDGQIRVRHLLEVLVQDIGLKAIARRAQRRMGGIRVIPYYGCLVVRPYMEFDAPDLPTSMDRLLMALGAQVLPYIMKTRCCGGVLMTTNKPIAIKLVGDLLLPAQDADCIVTVCPLCQLNLDAYQKDVSAALGVPIAVPVLYFTQFLGLAFALPEEDLRLDRNITSPGRLLKRLEQLSAWV